MDNNSTVIFLDYFEDLKEAIPFIRSVSVKLKSKPIVVTSNHDTGLLAEFFDLKIVYFDELLSSQDYSFMEKSILGLAETWYSALRPVERITEYKGIKFGQIREERAHQFFISTIKNLQIVLKIIEGFHPRRMIFIGESSIFKNLSLFVRREFNLSVLFIKGTKKGNVFVEIIKCFRSCCLGAICYLCDRLMQKLLIRKKADNGIFVDTRLYFELRGLAKEFPLHLYLIEKGLRIRSMLIKKEKCLFAPLSTGFLRLPSIFDAFTRYWWWISRDREFLNRFTYKGLAIWNILEPFIRELIVYDFSRVNKNILFLERLFNTLKPKLVVLREATRGPERTIALVAKQLAIPSLVVQHGILAGRNVHTKLLVDKVALWGRSGIDWYAAYGNESSKCVVTGRIDHDHLYLRSSNYKKKLNKLFLKIGADLNKETVLYVASDFKRQRHLFCVYYSLDAEYFAFNSILHIAKCFSEKQWIIKIHPFDPVNINSLINSKIKDCPNVFVVKDIEIAPLIKLSSLVITSNFSSAGLDATILNKPMITLNYFKREDLVPFAERQVALSVKRPEQLYRAVKRIFEDQELQQRFAANREGFIYDYAYKIDGQSTERVYKLIKEMCQRN